LNPFLTSFAFNYDSARQTSLSASVFAFMLRRDKTARQANADIYSACGGEQILAPRAKNPQENVTTFSYRLRESASVCG
jgi:hypothetical protein